jgi:anti-sigma B factor antagonist
MSGRYHDVRVAIVGGLGWSLGGGVVGLSVSIERRADATIVVVVGDIDMSTVEQLDSGIIAAAGTDESNDVLVDLSGVTFMDSTGINALLKGRRVADACGRRYRVVGAAGIVHQVLDLTGVLPHLSGAGG